jgi:chorismate dehydratase
MLRIGEIQYANCTPLFHVLKERFSCENYEFISGVPAELNAGLVNGLIDVCPSSSIEYAYHSDRYRILPKLSISSDGAVASVLLFSRVPVQDLNGQTILLSSESATSVNLLKILMAQLYGCSCDYQVNVNRSVDVFSSYPAFLLIGDAALRASMSECNLHVYDLGQLWRDWTGLPFVFALWMCRNEVASKEQLKELHWRLIQAKDLAPSFHESIVTHTPEAQWMSRKQILEYWRNNISYQLEDRHLAGLMTFFEKCYDLKLLTMVPALNFISP